MSLPVLVSEPKKKKSIKGSLAYMLFRGNLPYGVSYSPISSLEVFDQVTLEP